jgi:hypothetical protein
MNGLVPILLARKQALEATIAERHRQARENATSADVRALSATLRGVKRQIAIAQAQRR